MKIAISVESTADLTKELLSEFDISLIPYTITLGNEVFKDGEIPTEELFKKADALKMLPKTTALNSFEYSEYFTSLLTKYDAVVHLCLSSGLSSACQNAINASKEFENVFVVDSKSLSTGIGLLAIYGRKLALEGKSAEEISQILTEKTSDLQVSFVIERLDYLYKGGRCSAMQYFGANLLKFRPKIAVKNGKMGSDGKYRGSMDRVVSKYCAQTLESNKPNLSMAFVTYTTASPEMVSAAREALINAGFENIYETHAGGTIASHCGAHTLGILYFTESAK
jgi:DegV family protein with EDD domain